MATKIEERQKFVRYYKKQTGTDDVNSQDVAAFAVKMGWPLPPPLDPLDRLAKQFSEALREEIRYDEETKRPYRANLAFPQQLRDGKQLTLWADVDEAPRHKMVKGLHLYREQMVGEAVIGTNTADHWNRKHPDQEPLPFPKDFTDDVNWRLNAPEDVEKAG